MAVMGPGPGLQIAPPVAEADWRWLEDLWRTAWGEGLMISRGRAYRLADLCSLIAWKDGQRQGAATYWVGPLEGELVSLNAIRLGEGIGSALLAAVERAVADSRASRLVVVTSNDNL